MVSYAAPEPDDTDDSLDYTDHHPRSSRKRAYPNAFLDTHRQDYHYPSSEREDGDTGPLPVALDDSSQPLLPLGLAPGKLMDCLRTSVSWICDTFVEYGGKVFSAVGLWMDKKKPSAAADQGHSPPKRQRVSPRRDDEQTNVYHDDPTETSPLLSTRQPQSLPLPRYPTQRTQRPKSQRGINVPDECSSSLESPDPFLSGAPYFESRHTSLPQVPHRRQPPPSRKERFKNIASRLQHSGSTDSKHHSIPAGGAIRKSHGARPTPYDRAISKPKTSPKEAESRLAALERRAQTLQVPSSKQLSAPTYKWGDEEVTAEFNRHYRRPSQRTNTVGPSNPQGSQFQEIKLDEEVAKFEFKFSTPIPTRFNFGGQFTSPPRSGVPEHVKKSSARVPGIDKSQFRFELPPSTEKQRVSSFPFKTSGPLQDVTDGFMKTNAMHVPKRKEKGTASMPVQTNRLPKSQSETSLANDTFTILANPTPPEKPLVQKTLPINSQAITYHIQQPRSKKEPTPQVLPPDSDNPPQEDGLPHSYPTTMTTSDSSRGPPATPTHRRTVSAHTPTRVSRRAKFTTTYAEDSHREFIRELRDLLGQKKAKKDQEEREIDLQIAKLREEGKAVEGTLAGELPRLPELLARKVHEALFDTPDSAILVENSFGKISGKDIHKLQKGEWLNDEIINYYLTMIRFRSLNAASVLSSKVKPPKKPLPKIHTFSTYFFQLWSQRGYAGVKRWTKKARIDVFDLDMVLVPINKGGFHWVLGVVNVEAQRIEYYDSMGREGESADNRPYLLALRTFMVEEAKTLRRDSESVAKWSFYVPKTPKQKNGWDCGVFTCATAERLTGELGRMNYGQDHMDRLREYMVAEIIDGVFYH